jgi:anti-sigma factor RsiW
MAGRMDSADEAALWRRWRHATGDGGAAGPEPDAMVLAAYAESRLEDDAAAVVEAWLADNPQSVRDVLAARQMQQVTLPAAPELMIARAAALMGGGEAEILPFRRPTPRVRSWRGAVGWGAVAASLLVASLAGFATGGDTYATLAGVSNSSLGQELLDPPSGLFPAVDEDSNI